MVKISKRILVGGLLVLASVSLNSCLAVAAGAGAGYLMHEEGYRVQSPVVKEE